MEILLEAAGDGRYGQRDRTLLLVMYRHGLRVSESNQLRWEQFDMKAGLLSVQRLKHGVPSITLSWSRIARLAAAAANVAASLTCLFPNVADRMTASNARKLVARTGVAAKLPFPVHPHMLRHGLRLLSSPTRVTTRDPCSIIWGTRTSRIRCVHRTCVGPIQIVSGRMERAGLAVDSLKSIALTRVIERTWRSFGADAP